MTAWRFSIGMSLVMILGNAPKDDPLLRPIQPIYATRFLKPQPPIHVHGNSYLVGFGGVTVALIKTRAGLILIDGALPQGVREIEANIRRLGFTPGDVKLILSTEPHYDHAGGLAALVRDTGATVVAGAAAAPILRSGIGRADDPQAPMTSFPGVAKVRAVGHGARIRLGEATITAIATPGHTPGSTSWTWQSCEGTACVPVVFAASLNPAASDGYRFSAPANRGVVTSFRQSFVRLRTQPCGILITAHPEQSGGDAKYARRADRDAPNPYLDPGACRAYADNFAAVLDGKLRTGK